MKRQKNVFTTMAAIAELWAKQSQASARCRNGYFRDVSIYSYGRHYLLGRLMSFNGKKIAAVNTTYCSRTTSGHTRDAFRAARNAKLFVVEFSGSCIDSDTSDEMLSAAIVATIERQQQSLYECLESALYNSSDWGLRHLKSEINRFNDEIKYLGLSRLKISVPDCYFKEAMEIAKLERKARNDRDKRTQTFLGETSKPVSRYSIYTQMYHRAQKQVS